MGRLVKAVPRISATYDIAPTRDYKNKTKRDKPAGIRGPVWPIFAIADIFRQVMNISRLTIDGRDMSDARLVS